MDSRLNQSTNPLHADPSIVDILSYEFYGHFNLQKVHLSTAFSHEPPFKTMYESIAYTLHKEDITCC